ncbi:hypothetical protein IH982_03395 [Patescibacteria group bacterium]|nr:hypothetical protein [Patescibacteria group bacterium]
MKTLIEKGIVFFGALTVFLLLLHATDEIARGAAAQQYAIVGAGVAVLFFILLMILYVFGIGWAWKQRRLGYGIVLVASAAAFLRTFAVILGLGNPDLEALFAAYASEAVGVFFVFVYLAIALTSLMALFLSIYALVIRKRE